LGGRGDLNGGGNRGGSCGRRGFGVAWVKFGDAFAGIADHTDIHQARHIVFFREKDGENLAINFRRFIKRRFIRLVREQVLAHRDLVTNFLVPLANNAALYRLPLARHDYGCCHVVLLL